MKKKLNFSFLAALLVLGMSLSGCNLLNVTSESHEHSHSSEAPSSSEVTPSEETSTPSSSSKSSEPSVNPSSPSESSEPSTPSEPSSSVEEHVHVWGAPTWVWTKSADSYTAKANFVCATDSTHKETVDAQVVKGTTVQPTCTEAGSTLFTATASHGGKTFTDTKTDSINALNHELVHHDGKAATCTESGWEAYDTCARCNYTTYKEIAATGHEFETTWQNDASQHWHACKHGCGEKSDLGNHVLKTRETITNATCATEGSKKVETYCEICGLVVKIERTVENKVEHKYVLDETKSVAPTCTTGGVRYYTCGACGDSYTETLTSLGHDYQFVSCTEPYKCSRCDAVKEAPGHQYELDEENSHRVTCEQDGSMRYVCKVCGDSYTDTTAAEGHEFYREWQFDRTEHDDEVSCLDHDIYYNWCERCYEKVEKSEPIYRHQYIAKITKNATCVAAGEKQYVCKACGAVEKTEPIEINPEAHNWDQGTTVGNVSTFHCLNEGCNATKTSVVATEKNIEVSSSDFAAVEEVKLTNAALTFDNASKEMLAEKDLKIEVKETTAGQIAINNEEVNIPADTKVYDFSITDSEDNPLYFSDGASGKVTVRLPYEIQEGEDADNLIIYYVNEYGDIDEFEAKYENGFAVFETNHFSYYLVSYMTPAQACNKFGHRWSDTVTVEPTCLTRGYSYEVCARCGETHFHDEIAPLGHSFVVDPEGSKEATCTEPGYSGVVCEHCHQQYGQVIPAKGHNYQQKSVVAPTCTEPGSVTFECSECGDSYVTVIPAKGHTYAPVTTPATCQKEGKIEYVCKDCGHVDETRTIALEKLEHEYVLDSETDEEYVYKCAYGCGETKVVSKNSAPLTETSVLHKHFFTNTAKSIEGEELSLHSGEFTFQLLGENSGMLFSAHDSEGHIGRDANGRLLVYASSNYNMSGNEEKGVVYLLDNKLYLMREADYDGVTYMVYDLDSIGNPVFTVGELLNSIPELVEFLDTDVKTFLDNLLDYNDERLNKTVYHLLDRLFTFKSTPNGYDIILDFDKVAALNEKLNTKSIAECIDYLLGEGKTNEVLNKLEQYTSLSLYDALEKLKEDYGLDYKEVIRLIDRAIMIITGRNSLRDLIFESSNETVDIDEYLSDEYLREHSINSLVKDTEWAANFLDDKTLSAYIKKDIKELLDKNLYTLLIEKMNMDEEWIEELQGHISDYVNELKDSNSKVVLKLGQNGEFISFSIVLDLENEDIILKGDLQVYFNSDYRSVFNYDEIYRLSENVTKVIKAERFSSEEQILSHFEDESYVEVVRNETGKLEKVIVSRGKRAPDYYGNKEQQDLYVESEEDLFSLVGYKYYFDIVDVYKEYKDRGIMQIERGSFSTYTISDFTPTNIIFSHECGNKYDYEYRLPAEYEGRYNATRVTVYGADGEVLYREVFSSDISKYTDTYDYFYGTLDLASNKIIEGEGTQHSYVLVDYTDPSTVKCGEKVTMKYVCADCGAVRDASYIKSHTELDRDNIISATLVNPMSSCWNGVNVTYKCEDCGEEVTTRVYDHIQMKLNEFETESGTKVSVYGCPCRNSQTTCEIDGYYQASDYGETYPMHKAGTDENDYEYVYCNVYYPKEFDPENQNSEIYIGYRYENNDCQYATYVVVYEGCQMNEGMVTYTSKTEFKSDEGTYHGQSFYVKDSFKPVDPTDFSKGYTYQEACENCGQTVTYTVDENMMQALRIKLSDLGYTHTYGGYIEIYATAKELYKIATSGQGIVQNVEINAHGCSFDYDAFKDDESNYWEVYRCCVSDDETQEACTFKYAECHRYVRERVGNHTGAEYRPILIGCDEYGKNPLLTLKQDYHEYELHNFHSSDPVVYDTDNINIKIKVATTVCDECGYEDSESGVVFTSQPYEETKTVNGEDGLTYVYQEGYLPDLGVGSCYVYDASGRTVRFTEGNVHGGGSSSYRYYELWTREVKLGFYNYQSYESEVTYTSHYYNSNNKDNSHYHTETTHYYYPFENGEEFARLFLEITGFEYNLEKYGCYRIIETVDSEGYRNVSLEQFHMSGHLVGDKESCSQYNAYACDYCGKVILEEPHGHNFYYDDRTGTYICVNCGTHSYNSYNGEVILENLTKLSEEKVTVGFFVRESKKNGQGLDAFNARVNITVRTSSYDEVSLYDLKVTDVSDGVNNKFEISLEDLFNALSENKINKKDVSELRLYFEGYDYGDYYGKNFYETLVLTADELGIDTTRYYSSTTSEYLYNVSSHKANLVISPSRQEVLLTIDGVTQSGTLHNFYNDYITFDVDGNYYELQLTWSEYGYLYQMRAEYDEELYENRYFYFIENEEQPESGFGFLFADNTFMVASQTDDFDGYSQYVITNQVFRRGQEFKLVDFSNKATWIVDLDPYSFGGNPDNELIWPDFVQIADGTYKVMQDFYAEAVYIKLKMNQDVVYFQLG